MLAFRPHRSWDKLNNWVKHLRYTVHGLDSVHLIVPIQSIHSFPTTEYLMNAFWRPCREGDFPPLGWIFLGMCRTSDTSGLCHSLRLHTSVTILWVPNSFGAACSIGFFVWQQENGKVTQQQFTTCSHGFTRWSLRTFSVTNADWPISGWLNRLGRPTNK